MIFKELLKKNIHETFLMMNFEKNDDVGELYQIIEKHAQFIIFFRKFIEQKK